MAPPDRVNPVEASLRRIADHLTQAGRRWAVVGGLAVGARAEPRTTRDVDLAVAVVDDLDAEALVYALQSFGYRVLRAMEHEGEGRLATVRLSPPGESAVGGVLVDLLFASCGIEPDVVEGAECLEIVPDLRIPVATIGHLLAMKTLARDDRLRPQDWDDLQALLREAGPDDLDEARAAIRLIEQRGYHRGRDLLRAFEDLVRDMGTPG